MPEALRGRGAAERPPGRFERIVASASPAPAGAADPGAPPTRYLRDPSRSALSTNRSPDLPFDASLNPYRGCEHGCIYCYARPTHEYLGLSAGLDFETTIFVKDELPSLLRRQLASPRWKPQPVAIAGVTDPYQPIERSRRLTRRCLEVFASFRNPVSVVTKSALVTRDADLLADLARDDAAVAYLSITTLDPELQRVLEPRAAPPRQRLRAVEALSRAGVPTGVLVAPVIPGLTDHETAAIVAAAAGAGARFARQLMLRLPHGVADLFEAWLERHRPERRSKVMNRMRSLRGGRLEDPRFHVRMTGEGVFADHARDAFALACRRVGIPECAPLLSTRAFRRTAPAQLDLFFSS
jgi:DNA repair photolyase